MVQEVEVPPSVPGRFGSLADARFSSRRSSRPTQHNRQKSFSPLSPVSTNPGQGQGALPVRVDVGYQPMEIGKRHIHIISGVNARWSHSPKQIPLIS